MNPIGPQQPHSISHHSPKEDPSKILFELPETLPPQTIPSTNTLALTWLMHTIDPDIKLPLKDMTSVYFLLVTEAIGKAPFVRF